MRLDYLDKDCITKIREAAKDERFDKDKFLKWLEKKNVAGKNRPSAFFATVFPDELAKGTFYKDDDLSDLFVEQGPINPVKRRKYSVEEYLNLYESWDEFPEPIDDEDAMNQDEATKLMWEGTIKTLCGTKAKAFTKPIPPKKREEFLNGFYPEYMREQYRRYPEYLDNTWIAVYDESRERNEPMRKTCERKGLKTEGLIW